MAQTCALIAAFQPVLHRVSSINETLPNALKHYKTHQNMSLGFNWVDCVRSFWKLLTRLHGTNLCILPFQPALHRLSCSNNIIQNEPNHYEMHQIMSLGSNGVDRLCSLWKIPMWHRGTNLCLIAPFQPVLHLALSINKTLPNAPKHYETHQNRVSCSNERFPNAPKHYETHQNRSLGSNWVYR